MKKAFSLIELLIVILIVGIVYTLSIGNFKKMKDDTKKLSLQDLKEYLQELPHEDSAKILCLDDCTTCDIFIDGKKYNKNNIEIFLDKNVKTYRYDFSLGMVELEKNFEICFSYSVDKKGVGEQVFVEFKDKVYDFTAYLGSTPVYESIQEAVDAKEKINQEVLR